MNPDASNVTYRQSVNRRIPTMNKVVLIMLYIAVFVFTLMGAFSGVLMLIPTLGTLFFAWYYKGVVTVVYDYELDGYDLHIRRISGTRAKPVNVAFAYVDLHKLIVIADQFSAELEQGENVFDAQPKSRRVTYYTSAQDPNKPSVVLYAHGSGPEEGYIVRIYLQATGPLLHCLKTLCPGKVFTHADLI